MDLYNSNLMYEFHAKDLTQPEPLKQLSDHAVKEIKHLAGHDADVEVTIEPEAKDKKLYSVSMNVFVSGENIFVKKEGKNVISVLKKVRKAVVRKLHDMHRRQISIRKRSNFKEPFAS